MEIEIKSKKAYHELMIEIYNSIMPVSHEGRFQTVEGYPS